MEEVAQARGMDQGAEEAPDGGVRQGDELQEDSLHNGDREIGGVALLAGTCGGMQRHLETGAS
eukprot:6983362-Karenia_brevis.AAC.1